jgi:hypothetical protein
MAREASGSPHVSTTLAAPAGFVRASTTATSGRRVGSVLSSIVARRRRGARGRGEERRVRRLTFDEAKDVGGEGSKRRAAGALQHRGPRHPSPPSRRGSPARGKLGGGGSEG